MATKRSEIPPIEIKQFQSLKEIDRGIAKLEKRVKDLEELDVSIATRENTGALEAIESSIRESVLNVFGINSPEYIETESLHLSGYLFPMQQHEKIKLVMERRKRIIGIIRGLIDRLKEKREEFETDAGLSPTSYFDQLKLHPRIVDVSRDLFMDGHPWEAVFAGSKALINYVKERSGKHDLDGADLMRQVFSKKNPILALNDLITPTDFDDQEGMMHLFEGAVLGIRNPGGHTFPEGTEQRAIEYISLLSLLAYRVQEAKLRKSS
jgi:uncharacterized protein (TIGR02391 family)